MLFESLYDKNWHNSWGFQYQGFTWWWVVRSCVYTQNVSKKEKTQYYCEICIFFTDHDAVKVILDNADSEADFQISS